MQPSSLLGWAVFATIVRLTSPAEAGDDEVAAKRIAMMKCQHYLDMVSIPHDIMTLEMDSRVRKVYSVHCPLQNPYVVGGRRVEKYEFPHMVALGFWARLIWPSGGVTLNYTFQCGGTLISELFVMTAAHCINKDLAIVRVGVVDLNDPDAEDIWIVEKIVHEDYSPETRYDDIALLRLERNVTISLHVRPACLGTDRTERIHRATVTGWGKTSQDSHLSDSLGKVSLDVPSDRKKCARMYRGIGQSPLIDRQICAGSLDGNQDACHGDSGGPLQVFEEGECRYHVVGVVSYGKICGSAEYGLYTRVSRYLGWIVKTAWPDDWSHQEYWESW
ncbi:AAEL005823-PA [Aedes aegypti]|uniref:AAEL005823-PA n=1 Tax=Aedes aegypti TaxID=7159 RepID=Q178P0_AEDAE|nr:AAEL005823-PA [Aedes aegypti]